MYVYTYNNIYIYIYIIDRDRERERERERIWHRVLGVGGLPRQPQLLGIHQRGVQSEGGAVDGGSIM